MPFVPWQENYENIVSESADLIILCEKYINELNRHEKEISAKVIERLKNDIKTNSVNIRSPFGWATMPANVAIRISKKLISKRSSSTYIDLIRLSNFCGVVFNKRRESEPQKYESLFRQSLKDFIGANLELSFQNHSIIISDAMDQANSVLKKYYKPNIPRDVALDINDAIYQAFDKKRSQLDNESTKGLMLRFMEDNQDILKLHVSERVSHIKINWVELLSHHLGHERVCQILGNFSIDFKSKILKAIATNDPFEVRDVIALAEEELKTSVLKILGAEFSLQEPNKKVKDSKGNLNPEFESARRQLRSNNSNAINSFRFLWQTQPRNSYIKEWYAYALCKIEKKWVYSRSLFNEIIQSNLGDAITDWNFACCDIYLNNRNEAFKSLRQGLVKYPDNSSLIEPAIKIAIENNDKSFLAEYLDWIPNANCVFLAFLYAADTGVAKSDLIDRLSTLDAISSDDCVLNLPDPAEILSNSDLNRVCFEFVQKRIFKGGITWFQQRISYKQHRFNAINYRLIGDLYISLKMYEQAFKAYSNYLTMLPRSTVEKQFLKNCILEVIDIFKEQPQYQKALELLKEVGLENLDQDQTKAFKKTLLKEIGNAVSAQIEDKATLAPVKTVLPTNGNLSGVKNDQDLLALISSLSKIKKLTDLDGNHDIFNKIFLLMSDRFPLFGPKIIESFNIYFSKVAEFQMSIDLSKKEELSGEVGAKFFDLKSYTPTIDDPNLKINFEHIINAIERITQDISCQTNVSHNVEIDSKITNYLPDSLGERNDPNNPKTIILLRIINSGSETISELSVFLKSEKGNVIVEHEQETHKDPLEPGMSIILGFKIDYDSIDKDETFTTYAQFSYNSFKIKTQLIRFTLKPKCFEDIIGGKKFIEDSFFIGVGIPENRRDVFHGRSREQIRICNSLRDAVQSEILFLNGPRRVGKTSILNSLYWSLPENNLNHIIPVSLPEAIPQDTAAYLYSIIEHIQRGIYDYLKISDFIPLPDRKIFFSEPISGFLSYSEKLKSQLDGRQILLMIDETQRLASAIKEGKIDRNVLDLFSTLMSKNSGILFIFTASVLYRDIKVLSDSAIWGRLTQVSTGFLSKDAIKDVLKAGISGYPVVFTEEAVDLIWNMTEGHPWITQAIGKRIVTEVLNPQKRLNVGPCDVYQAVAYIEEKENQYCDLWWNEKKHEGGFIDELDWEIAKIIIQDQKKSSIGVPRDIIFEIMQKKGKLITNERILKLMEMQTIQKEFKNGIEYLRIKGLFLERWLCCHHKILASKSNNNYQQSPKIALFVDHENMIISLREYIKALPMEDQKKWDKIAETKRIAKMLSIKAERLGKVIPPRWAVANWQLFTGDLKAYTEAMFEFSSPLGGKNGSDERLKQLIRNTLDENDDVDAFVIVAGDGDYRDTILTLLKHNKKVILWGTKSIGSIRSNISNTYKEMATWQNISIEYLDDLLLDG